MITISCYTFHPFIQRFVRLYRQAQVISDWLNYFLSFFCCQCLQPYPPTAPTSDTSEINMECPAPKGSTSIDPERAGSGEPLRPQYVRIDFTPDPRDTAETAARCKQFFDLVDSQPELEKIKVISERSPYVDEDECVPVHKKKSKSRKQSKNKVAALKSTTISQHKDPIESIHR